MLSQAATRQQLADVIAAMATFAQDVQTNIPPFAPAAEESDLKESWPGLFWLPPANDEPGERDMLLLDDELAGLLEATEVSADQHETHTTITGPPPSVLGKIYEQTEINCCTVCLVLCCAVLSCAVLCCLWCAALHCSMVISALLCPHLTTFIFCAVFPWHCCPSQGGLRRALVVSQMQLTTDVEIAVNVLTGADVSMPRSASVTEQSSSEMIVPSHALQVSTGAMLHLDDELAGLVEAADMPAGQDGGHTTKPEPTSSVPGEAPFDAQSAKNSGVLCMWVFAAFYRMVKLYLCCHALHVVPLPCRAVTCSCPCTPC